MPVSSLLCHASTCCRSGSKFRCIRSTPTEMQSIRENDFECLASTRVNTPGTMSPNFDVDHREVKPAPPRHQEATEVWDCRAEGEPGAACGLRSAERPGRRVP